MFKNKKAELVKEKAIVELEEFTNIMLKKMEFAFETLEERDRYKNLLEIEKNKTKVQEEKIKSLKEIVKEQKAYLKDIRKILYSFCEKIKINNQDIENLQKEIENLKSNRYLVKKIKGTNSIKQTMKVKSCSKNSEIIKKVKEK